jgi:hypothetical protein
MAKIILKLKKNEKGEQILDVEYESAPDAMAFEHEADHKNVIRKLLGSDKFNEEESLEVSRESSKLSGEKQSQPQDLTERKKQGKAG